MMSKIPSSNTTCTVRVIDSTSTIHYPAKHFFTEPISSHKDLNCPAFVFLVTDASGKRHILFDLGVRKDWKTGLPAPFVKGLTSKGAYCEVEKDVADILDEQESNEELPKSKDIEAIVWSHHHFDHTGNPNLFPFSTSIVVGPGFVKATFPGYPRDQSSSVPSSCWENREVKELDFINDKRLVNFDDSLSAIDYFNDGSFYLISTPGHAPGHLSGLARVTPSTFILMGGDVAHHGGEIRPTSQLPLPKSLPLPSSKKYTKTQCPGEILASLQPGRHGSITIPFYQPADDFCTNKKEAIESIESVCNLDARGDVFVILAHDRTLKETIPLFPKTINNWKELDLANKTRWLFVDDFAGAVDEMDD